MWFRKVFPGQIKPSRLTELKVGPSSRINACNSSLWLVAREAGYRQAGQTNGGGGQNTPSLSNSIRVQGPREVMSQLYRPPVLFALCRGSASARGAPTSNLGTKQKDLRDLHAMYFKCLARTQSWGHYSVMQSTHCSAAEELGTTNILAAQADAPRSWGMIRPVSLTKGMQTCPSQNRQQHLGALWCWKTLYIEQAQKTDRKGTTHTPNFGREAAGSCSIW